MSQENVELVRALTDTANRIDIDALIALLSPRCREEETADLPEPERSSTDRTRSAWAEELLEVIESATTRSIRSGTSGDRVFAENVLAVHGREAARRRAGYWALYSIKNGKIARHQVFWNGDEALEAPGCRSRDRLWTKSSALHGSAVR